MRQLGGGLLAIQGISSSGEMMYAAQIEHALTGGRTGALNHIMQEHGVQGSLIRINRSYVNTSGEISAAAFEVLKGWHAAWKQKIDPFTGPPKEVSMLPYKVAVTLALSRRDRQLLENLRAEVPQEWILEDQQAANTTEGLVDLVLDETLEQMPPADQELAEICLQQELQDGLEWDVDGEPEIPNQYSLKPQRKLQKQLAVLLLHGKATQMAQVVTCRLLILVLKDLVIWWIMFVNQLLDHR